MPSAPAHRVGFAYVPALDGLRAVAVALVFLRHVPWAGGPLLGAGWIGVDLFFVLSGFLISRVLLDARGDGPQSPPSYYRRFYARRVRRILPASLVAALLITLMDPGAVVRTGWPLTAYVANLVIVRDGWSGLPYAGTHFWSLAIEEQFYLVWPALIAWCPRRRLAPVCVALAAAAFAVRVALLDVPVAAFVLTPARTDGFAIGALVALAHRWPGWRWLFAPALVVAVLALWLDGGAPEGPVIQTVGYTALALASGGAVAWALTARPASLLASAPLREIGRRSYAVYLFHLPVVRLLFGAGVVGWPLLVGAAAATAAVAWASWRVVEMPFLARQHSHAYEPAATAAD